MPNLCDLFISVVKKLTTIHHHNRQKKYDIAAAAD